MAPPNPSAPRLPVAADHAAIANRISMSLGATSSLLKTLNPSSSASSPSLTSTPRHVINHNDEDDLWKDIGGDPKRGLGFLPDSRAAKEDATSREDKLLRGKLLGKRALQQREQARRKKEEDSESEEDAGRSALGKRKRPRKAVEVEEEEEKAAEADRDGDEAKAGKVEADDAVVEQEAQMEGVVEEAEEMEDMEGKPGAVAETAKSRRKKKKREKKKSKSKTSNGDGEGGNATSA